MNIIYLCKSKLLQLRVTSVDSKLQNCLVAYLQSNGLNIHIFRKKKKKAYLKENSDLWFTFEITFRLICSDIILNTSRLIINVKYESHMIVGSQSCLSMRGLLFANIKFRLPTHKPDILGISYKAFFFPMKIFTLIH